MIATIKEATAHAAQFLTKSDFIAVLPDGHIYLFDSADGLLKYPDAFIVKGTAPKPLKEKKSKEIKDTE